MLPEEEDVVASREFNPAPILEDGIAATEDDEDVKDEEEAFGTPFDNIDTFRWVTSRSMEKWVSCTVAACVAAATAAAAAAELFDIISLSSSSPKVLRPVVVNWTNSSFRSAIYSFVKALLHIPKFPAKYALKAIKL